MPITLYRAATVRVLLQAACLEHLWTGTDIAHDARGVLMRLHAENPRDAVFLSTALAIRSPEYDGPFAQELLMLDEPDRTALRLALVAQDGPKQAQTFLAWMRVVYKLGPFDSE